MTAITPAGPGHAAVIAALHGLCFGNDAGTPWDEPAVTGLLAMPGAVAFVASREATPAGFVLARVAADEAEIIAIGTVPDHRRQGIAGALLDRTIDAVAGAGAGRIFLEVAADNASAIQFYEARGFQVCGARPGYYRRSQGLVDAHIMVLEIARRK